MGYTRWAAWLAQKEDAGRWFIGIAGTWSAEGKSLRSQGLRLAPEEGKQYAKDTYEAEDYTDTDNVAAQNPAEYQKGDPKECIDLARKTHKHVLPNRMFHLSVRTRLISTKTALQRARVNIFIATEARRHRGKSYGIERNEIVGAYCNTPPFYLKNMGHVRLRFALFD